jgi:hypothetical protein
MDPKPLRISVRVPEHLCCSKTTPSYCDAFTFGLRTTDRCPKDQLQCMLQHNFQTYEFKLYSTVETFCQCTHSPRWPSGTYSSACNGCYTHFKGIQQALNNMPWKYYQHTFSISSRSLENDDCFLHCPLASLMFCNNVESMARHQRCCRGRIPAAHEQCKSSRFTTQHR